MMSEENKNNTPHEKSIADMFEAARKKSEEHNTETPTEKSVTEPTTEESKKSEESENTAPTVKKVSDLIEEAGKKSGETAEKAKNEPEGLAELAGEGTRKYTMDRHFSNMKGRRRRPKSLVFFKRLAIVCVAVLVAAAIAFAVLLKLSESTSKESSEAYMQALVAENDTDGWKQFLRMNFADNYPAYAKPADIAYKVLSPVFNVKNVTYSASSDSGDGTYMLFSDGRHFADITFEKTPGLFSRDAEVSSISFDLSFFDTVEFPQIKIYVPDGATLTVNGVKMAEGAPQSSSGAAYPGVSRGETAAVTSVLYTFDDIYYVPELSATLDGKELVLHSDDATHTYWFEYPAEMTHSIVVEVPAEATAMVGGKVLTAEWAKLEYVTGALGSLDDGGTGTLPQLARWTVEGLFNETAVRAFVGEKELKADKTEKDSYYSFEIPDVCRYQITVLYPGDAVLSVNGKTSSDTWTKIKADAAALATSSTAIGRFGASGLSVVSGAVPDFTVTTVSGYLAEPTVSVTLSGATLTPVMCTKNGYEIRYEFDIPVTGSGAVALPADSSAITGSSSAASSAISSSGTQVSSSGAFAAATEFFDVYLRYVCSGGIAEDPTNRAVFDANHDALVALTHEGSAGYYSALESYTEASMRRKCASFGRGDITATDIYEYTGVCLCFTLSAPVVTDAGTYTQVIDFMTVCRDGTWIVWAFEDSSVYAS